MQNFMRRPPLGSLLPRGYLHIYFFVPFTFPADTCTLLFALCLSYLLTRRHTLYHTTTTPRCKYPDAFSRPLPHFLYWSFDPIIP